MPVRAGYSRAARSPPVRALFLSQRRNSTLGRASSVRLRLLGSGWGARRCLPRSSSAANSDLHVLKRLALLHDFGVFRAHPPSVPAAHGRTGMPDEGRRRRRPVKDLGGTGIGAAALAASAASESSLAGPPWPCQIRRATRQSPTDHGSASLKQGHRPTFCGTRVQRRRPVAATGKREAAARQPSQRPFALE